MTGTKDNLKNEDIKKIQVNPKNPRLVFPQDKMDKLVTSIKERGILVPLSVFLDSNGKYTILDGERRFRAATQLGLTEVPIHIQERPEYASYVTDMFHIHHIREPWELMPTAKKLEEVSNFLKKTKGKEPTERELSKNTGLTISEVRRCRLALEFPENVRNLMLEEESKTQEERTLLGKDKLLTEDFFMEIAKNIIRPLEVYNQTAFREVGGTKKIYDDLVKKRRKGLIKNIVSLRPVAKYIRSKPNKAGSALKNFLAKPEISSDDLLNKIGLSFDIFKFERNLTLFTNTLKNIPPESNEDDKLRLVVLLKRVNKLVEQTIKELGK